MDDDEGNECEVGQVFAVAQVSEVYRELKELLDAVYGVKNDTKEVTN